MPFFLGRLFVIFNDVLMLCLKSLTTIQCTTFTLYHFIRVSEC